MSLQMWWAHGVLLCRGVIMWYEAGVGAAGWMLLVLVTVGKEAKVEVDQVGEAAREGDVIARLLRPRCRDLGFEIAGDEGGAGADLHGAEIAAEEIARVAVGPARGRGAAFGPFGSSGEAARVGAALEGAEDVRGGKAWCSTGSSGWVREHNKHNKKN